MKKLDNKGFAITGILYTLLILFLMVLLSVLTGLSTRKNMLEKSTESIEQRFIGNDSQSTSNIEEVKENKEAPVTGKYIFELSMTDNDKIICATYLTKGETINNNKLKDRFVPKDCNDYEYTFTFDNNNPEGLKMDLVNIYSFESE